MPTRPAHAPDPMTTSSARHPRALRAGALALAVVLGLTLSGAAGTWSADESQEPDYELIEEALGIIGERFVSVEALTEENLTEGAIRGIVEALGDDGHTTYLTPEELRIEQDALDGRVLGIGVVLDERAGDPHIIGVVDGSPADEVGLQAGDIIVSVDGQEAGRLSMEDLVALVRGTIGSSVRLGIERPGLPARLELDIVRADIEIKPASWAFVPGTDIAVVRIVQFSAQAARATRRVIEDALEADASGIVLDLRGNPGGLVDEARAVAGYFLDDGVLYRERDRHGNTTEVRIRPDETIAPDLPLTILIDYGTASSAEILASALRDNGRARLVGAQTYGTGTVLNTFHLSDGSAIRLAVRDWLTTSGEDVFGIGVAPDEEVELPLGAVALRPADLISMTADELERHDDAQLRRAIETLRPGLAAR